MDISTWVKFASGLDKSIDEFVIPLTSNAFFAEPEVKFIVQQLLVIRTTVEDNRKGPVGMDTGAQCG